MTANVWKAHVTLNNKNVLQIYVTTFMIFYAISSQH